MERQTTVEITVRFAGHLRRYGNEERAFTLPRTATVRQLLNTVADGSSDLQPVFFNASGEPNTQMLLFVDDEQSHAGQVLSDARNVTLMLPISGG